jgi:hypothetical protein
MQDSIQFTGKIAILSSGPSLLQSWQDSKFDNFDTVIAVNFAGFVFKHHWFSFWEDWILDAQLESPTLKRTVQRIEPLNGYIVPRPHTTDTPCLLMPMLVGASSYTSTEVIRYVSKRSAADATLDIFGLDLQGEIDCLGRTGANRDPNRWAKERHYVKPLVADPRVTVHGGIGKPTGF